MADAVKKSPTEDSFKKYLELLKPDIETADKDAHIAKTGYKDAVRSRQFKRCAFKKAKKSLQVYEGLLNNVVVAAHQDTTEIDKSIKSYLEQSTTIKNAFTALVQSLRAAKNTLGEVETVARALSEAVENSDQSEEAKSLKSYVPDFENDVRAITGWYKNKEQPVQGLADKTNDLADNTFEITIKVLAINSAINIESLEPLSKKLLSDISDLKTDIESNVSFAQKEKVTTQTNLTKQNQDQSIARIAKTHSRLRLFGTKNVEGFVNSTKNLTADESKALVKKTKAELERIGNLVENSFKNLD